MIGDGSEIWEAVVSGKISSLTSSKPFREIQNFLNSERERDRDCFVIFS